MLKVLAEAQELIWKQAMRPKDDHLTTFNYNTPTEKKKETQGGLIRLEAEAD
jgi:hypothetical protein